MVRTDEDIIKAAVETYRLEKLMDPDAKAIDAALAAGLSHHERSVISRIADQAEELAEHLKTEDDPPFEGIAVLEIFARDLRDQIPRQDRYEPQDDDIVQVIITGTVTLYDEECPNCGHDQDKTIFSVTDRASGAEYFFDPHEAKSLKVRVISPAGIDEMLS